MLATASLVLKKMPKEEIKDKLKKFTKKMEKGWLCDRIRTDVTGLEMMI